MLNFSWPSISKRLNYINLNRIIGEDKGNFSHLYSFKWWLLIRRNPDTLYTFLEVNFVVIIWLDQLYSEYNMSHQSIPQCYWILMQVFHFSWRCIIFFMETHYLMLHNQNLWKIKMPLQVPNRRILFLSNARPVSKNKKRRIFEAFLAI